MAKLFVTTKNNQLKQTLQAKGPGHFPASGFSLFSHRTMHRCLSVVWQVGACFRLPESRDLSTPGRPLGDHILGQPTHPWAIPGRSNPRESHTPGPLMGDRILGNPSPLGHPMGDHILGNPHTPEPPLGDHILGSPHPCATPGRPHPRGSPTPGTPLGDRILGLVLTPGPPLGDQFLGTPLPLDHPWVAKS